jgi:L-serine dehydratase
MRAANSFVEALIERSLLSETHRVEAVLYGSLGATGKGHGSDVAVILGLEGSTAESLDVDLVQPRVAEIRAKAKLNLAGLKSIEFNEVSDLVLHQSETLPLHSNGMTYKAFDIEGKQLHCQTYYSVGGGFVVDEEALSNPLDVDDTVELPYAFESADELLALCKKHNLSISQLMMKNEESWRSEQEIRDGLLEIWHAMQNCVQRGCEQTGILPGGLGVERRARKLFDDLRSSPEANLRDPLSTMDWVNLYALAVNEENAAGGRVVTAPTNGAAGIMPAIMHYYDRFVPGASDDGMVRFLLTAGAIGMLFKKNASISGAEVGCQGEVGSACSMAAGGLTEVMGGTPEQIENAAEIAMEHNLGLTCDPIGGLVQVPCIERNAMASIKAINAARLATRGNGIHLVSLDKVIQTMRDTGADMQTKYKETSLGGLAVSVIEC